MSSQRRPDVLSQSLVCSVRVGFRGKHVVDVLCKRPHPKPEGTVRYLGIEVDDAIEIAEQTEV